jgi:hypothetical protein
MSFEIVNREFESAIIRTAKNETNDLYICLIDLERESGIDRGTSLKYIEIFNSNEGLNNTQPQIELEIADNNGKIQNTKFIHQTVANFLIPKGRSDKAIKFSIWLAKVATELQKNGIVDLRPKTKKELAYELYLYEVKMEELENQKIKLLETQKAMSQNCYRNYVNQGTKTGLITKQNEVIQELEIKLDQSQEYATIKCMEIKLKKSFKWRPLKDYSLQNELEIKSVPDVNYGTVKSYHKIAWKNVYNVDI